MRLYIDGLRESPEGWESVKTCSEAESLVYHHLSQISAISLDYSLDNGKTGIEVLDYLLTIIKRKCLINVPPIKVHCRNKAHAHELQEKIDEIYKTVLENERSLAADLSAA